MAQFMCGIEALAIIVALYWIQNNGRANGGRERVRVDGSSLLRTEDHQDAVVLEQADHVPDGARWQAPTVPNMLGGQLGTVAFQTTFVDGVDRYVDSGKLYARFQRRGYINGQQPVCVRLVPSNLSGRSERPEMWSALR
jgi:hypothetical protein